MVGVPVKTIGNIFVDISVLVHILQKICKSEGKKEKKNCSILIVMCKYYLHVPFLLYYSYTTFLLNRKKTHSQYTHFVSFIFSN